MTDLAKSQPFQDIAERRAAFYQSKRSEYEPVHKGEYLAIEVDSGNAYLHATSAGALEAARAVHPGKLFYVVKVGFDSAETLAHSLVSRS